MKGPYTPFHYEIDKKPGEKETNWHPAAQAKDLPIVISPARYGSGLNGQKIGLTIAAEDLAETLNCTIKEAIEKEIKNQGWNKGLLTLKS